METKDHQLCPIPLNLEENPFAIPRIEKQQSIYTIYFNVVKLQTVPRDS